MVKEDLVSDGWTEAFRLLFGNLRQQAPSKLKMVGFALSGIFSSKMYKVGFKSYMTGKVTEAMDLRNAMQMADFQKMEKVRARADAVVEDKETAESLKPYYNQFCKRPCFHDEYLKTFNNPNVELVDTDGKGLEEISENGIIFEGKEYEVDCIIFATGFEVGTDYSRRAGYQIHGVDGMTVSKKWENGLATFHGMHSRGFPNSFFFGPAQSGFTATYTYSLDEQSIHLAHILKTTKDKGVTRIEASQEAEEKWIETIIDKARITADFQENCTPGYYNNEGKIQPTEMAAMTAVVNQSRPESRGSIHIGTANAVDAPKIHANYLSTELDRDTMVRGLRILIDVFSQPSLEPYLKGRLAPTPDINCDRDDELLEYIRGDASTVYHPTSTCSIGKVVDENLKVMGTESLNVVDASVMPYVVSGNTNAATIMVAEKAADQMLTASS